MLICEDKFPHLPGSRVRLTNRLFVPKVCPGEFVFPTFADRVNLSQTYCWSISHVMSLPVSAEYLGLSLARDKAVGDLTLRHKRVTELRLPTGKLVATDAFVFTEPQPFELPLPSGVFPVILAVAHFTDDQRVAFAGIRFRDTPPVAWDMLTLDGQDSSKLEEGHIFGYGVDSGTGCFIDASAARVLDRKMAEEPEFYQVMMTEMERIYVHTWSWLDMPFGNGNLVAFSSGVGDGAYATYAGFDTDGEIAVVVTDFSVVPLETT